MADEPTGDLDAKSAEEILDLMETLNREFKKTIVMVTHDPRAAERAHVQHHLEKGVFKAMEAAMKFLPFVLKHLRRNWIRTLSTVLAMAVCIFLFCTLQTVLASDRRACSRARAPSRLVTRHAVSLVFSLPLSYAQRIAAVPGVKRVATTTWFGGSLPAKKEGKATKAPRPPRTGATSSRTWRWTRSPTSRCTPSSRSRPTSGRPSWGTCRGAIIGRKLANKFGWKIGDTFFLESFIPPYRKRSGPFEFVVRAIFDADKVKHPSTDTNLMLFHYKYLYEGTGQRISGRHLQRRDRRSRRRRAR